MAEKLEKVLIPDLGGADEVHVIEVFVKPGDTIAVEDSLVTLESDKASMDVPSPAAGVVESVALKVGDTIGEGGLLLTLKVSGAASQPAKSAEKQAETKPAQQKAPEPVKAQEPIKAQEPVKGSMHAGPAVRRLAHELGIDLNKVPATGSKGRIQKSDILKYIKGKMSGGGAGGLSFLPAPKVDFTKFGEIEMQPLSKINKLSGGHLSRNWVSIPHVTQFEEADITEMEAFRKEQKELAAKEGIRLTPLVFIMKAVVAALHKFPRFNASLDESGENLILKKYFHIGVAVDTPNGLVVPVIRDVDKKGTFELAQELGAISEKAREKGLSIKEMQGGCFTISSLGGIGGTAFTPIINAPEVAILGVSKMTCKPVYQSANEFAPRLMLPLSLSYDHRVIDGAQAARFIVYLANCLADIRNILL